MTVENKPQLLPIRDFSILKEDVKDFRELLDSISSLEDKKKALYIKIYEQSMTDRNNAYCAYADLYTHVHGNFGNHAIHGQTLCKYLERMSKCTDQLLKLAELISVAEEKEEQKNKKSPTDIYNEIGKGKFS